MSTKLLIALAALACALTIARVLFEPGLPPYRPAMRLLKRWSNAAAWVAVFAQRQRPKVHTNVLPAALVAVLLSVAYALWPWSLLLAALVAFILLQAHASRARSSL